MAIISEIEEGSTSNSHGHNNHKQRYDIFLSFRGADTRNNFTDHLYNALVNDDIPTFLDDEEIETGEDLKPELENAIKSARASVIVLSKNYATSTWCLDELALILERRLTSNHIVIPIFYHVEPTDVRKQQNSFGDAMAEHRRKMKKERNAAKKAKWGEKIDRWYKVLTEVADLKGKDVKGRKEAEFIEEIVTEIRQRFGVPLSDTLPIFIGRYPHIEKITSWLTGSFSSHSADILTVLGMGGIGKTSLAKYVFHLHSRTFDKSCFIEGISLRCETGKFIELLDVQEQLFEVISKKKKRLIRDTLVYTSKIEKALARVKVFLVLDDIDSLDQLDVLLGNKGFYPGSKIIITTKDASLTERCALFKSKVKPKHTKLLLEGLSEDASLDLLCSNAFSCNTPKEGYEEVSKKVSKYCEGHPLALKVLGKALYNRDVDEWEDYIERLKSDPSIQMVLQMSFDSLSSENDKELFKHIACFFVGKERDYTETILKACKINTRTGISNLIDRCLLSIGWNNKLMMHQLLQEMGRDEVRKESPLNPWMRSRLWSNEDSYKVLRKKEKNMENILGLTLDMRVLLEKEKLRGSFEVETDVLSKMDNIMLLQLNYVQINGTYKNFPKELRWLCMHGFPLKSIPSDLPLDNLVALDMSYSNIESLFGMCWSNQHPFEGGQKVIGSCSKDKRVLGSLKILDLSFCEKLHTLGGFYKLPALERLIVRNCIRLIEIDELLAECIDKIVHIDLSYCIKLEMLPTSIHKLKKVETLLLDSCNISSLVEKISSDLNLRVISLPSLLVRLSLANNNLSNESFPMDLSCLSRLKYLCLNENPLVSMPSCVRSLCSLEELSMTNCKTMVSVERPPCTLKWLDVMVNRLDANKILERISFDPDMSPICTDAVLIAFRAWSFEIEGMVKIQPLEGVEEKVLRSLGWSNLSDFLDTRQVVVTRRLDRGIEKHQIQMYYEFGIFSTFYGGPAIRPDWISWSISSKTPFTIPSSPNKQLRGLNLCYVQRGIIEFRTLPTIEISNKTKNRTWGYKHCIHERTHVGGEWVTYLSHWMFGMNEMEAGDQIIITVKGKETDYGSYAYASDHYPNCGLGFVYEDEDEDEDEDGRMEEEEDALEYYKSWNHIIGGDLSFFQLTTGEYVLFNHGFMRRSNKGQLGFCGYRGSIYKDDMVLFRAFSKMKSSKTIRKLKGKMVGIGDRQPLKSVQGMPPSQAHSLQGASTSKLHICDVDHDDCIMTENEEKEKKESKAIMKKSNWWKIMLTICVYGAIVRSGGKKIWRW